jgi:hypothetical protein
MMQSRPQTLTRAVTHIRLVDANAVLYKPIFGLEGEEYPMQRLRDLRQYVTDLASIPHLSREETRQLTSCLAAARQGTLSPEQACHPWTCRRPASLRSSPEQAERRKAQVQRLEAACAELAAQGIPICVRALARTSHVDKKVIGPFVRLYWDQQGSAQVRPTKTYCQSSSEYRQA